jgi:hypothetical protein
MRRLHHREDAGSGAEHEHHRGGALHAVGVASRGLKRLAAEEPHAYQEVGDHQPQEKFALREPHPTNPVSAFPIRKTLTLDKAQIAPRAHSARFTEAMNFVAISSLGFNRSALL